MAIVGRMSHELGMAWKTIVKDTKIKNFRFHYFQGGLPNYGGELRDLLYLFVAIIRRYNTPSNAERTEATKIEVFAFWRWSGCVSNPIVAINVDMVKPIPAMRETPMMC